MRMVNNIERIGDHAENLAKVTHRKLAGNSFFTKEAL
ncbi:MAG: PhoU domain-containing protein [bacterium]